MPTMLQQALDRLLSAAGERDAYQVSFDDACLSDRKAWLTTRPSLPPLFFFALSTWAGIALATEALRWVCPWIAQTVMLCALILAAVAAALLWRGSALIGCIALGLALGCALGASHAYAVVCGQSQLLASKQAQVVHAVQDSRTGSYGSTFLARTESGLLVRVVDKKGSDILVGDAFIVKGGWKVPAGKTAQDSWRKGIAAVVTPAKLQAVQPFSLLQPLRDFRRAAIQGVREQGARLDERTGLKFDEARNMLSGIVLGYTAEFYDSSLYQAVKVDGLAHLMAVSGAHLAIVSGMIAAAFRRSSLPRAAAICMQVACIAGYLVLTGAPTSAVRAAIMATLGFASYFEARRPYALGGLSCCIVVMLALDPAAAFSTSLLLSAGATVGIILFSGYCTSLLCALLRIPGGVIVDVLALTVSASLLTAVPSASLFSQVSFIAPLSNLIVTPVFPFLCLGGFLCIVLCTIGGALGAAPLWCLLAALQLLCEVLKALASIPHAACPAVIDEAFAVPLAVLPAVILWLLWPRPNVHGVCCCFGITCGIALVFNCATFLRPDAVTVLDVGQGDAILIQSEGRMLLIDTGTEDTLLLRGLASCGVSSLDAVLLTHPDDDHCGSLPALKGVVGVENVLVAQDMLVNDDSHCVELLANARDIAGEDSLVGLRVGDVITLGRARLRVVGPDAFHDDGGNADSLVVVLEYDADGDGVPDVTGLFCGDAESEQLGEYIEQGRVGEIDLFKVGHHGSRASVDSAVLATLRPEVSLVSVGAYNRYGHPAPETLALLDEANSAIFRTDEQGAITCILQKDGIRVQTQR